MLESWGNPSPSEEITMSIDDREEEHRQMEELESYVKFYKEISEDFIEMIEQVEKKKKKFECLIELKNYIKKEI